MRDWKEASARLEQQEVSIPIDTLQQFSVPWLAEGIFA